MSGVPGEPVPPVPPVPPGVPGVPVPPGVPDPISEDRSEIGEPAPEHPNSERLSEIGDAMGPGAAEEAPRVPGALRAGFDRLPTAPVPAQSQSGPREDGSGEPGLPAWMPQPEAPRTRRGYAGWALGVAIVGLAVSLFAGWGLPLGLVAVVVAILALRRPWESRAIAVWALVLGGVSVLYSVGWLLWAASRLVAS